MDKVKRSQQLYKTFWYWYFESNSYLMAFEKPMTAMNFPNDLSLLSRFCTQDTFKILRQWYWRTQLYRWNKSADWISTLFSYQKSVVEGVFACWTDNHENPFNGKYIQIRQRFISMRVCSELWIGQSQNQSRVLRHLLVFLWNRNQVFTQLFVGVEKNRWRVFCIHVRSGIHCCILNNLTATRTWFEYSFS